MFIKKTCYLIIAYVFYLLLFCRTIYAQTPSLGIESSSNKSISITIAATLNISNIDESSTKLVKKDGYIKETNEICISSTMGGNYTVTTTQNNNLNYIVTWDDKVGHQVNLSKYPKGVEFYNASISSTGCQNTTLTVEALDIIKDTNNPNNEILITISPS